MACGRGLRRATLCPNEAEQWRRTVCHRHSRRMGSGAVSARPTRSATATATRPRERFQRRTDSRLRHARRLDSAAAAHRALVIRATAPPDRRRADVGITDVVRTKPDNERRPRLLDARDTTWSRPEGRDHEDAQAKQQRREQARAPDKGVPKTNRRHPRLPNYTVSDNATASPPMAAEPSASRCPLPAAFARSSASPSRTAPDSPSHSLTGADSPWPALRPPRESPSRDPPP